MLAATGAQRLIDEKRMMTQTLSLELLDDLRRFDTPTICDAIERLNVRGRLEGCSGAEVRCLLPATGIMLGYVTTVELDYSTLDRPAVPGNWLAWVKAMEACPMPGVLVIKDAGPRPRRAALWGDVMGWAAKQLGLVGVVTDGLVRDTPQLQALGMHLYAAGLTASHGNPRVLRVNVPVDIDGMRVAPGDLLHGSADGLATIPLEHAAGVAAAAAQISAHEAAVIDYTRSANFSVEGLFRMRFG